MDSAKQGPSQDLLASAPVPGDLSSGPQDPHLGIEDQGPDCLSGVSGLGSSTMTSPPASDAKSGTSPHDEATSGSTGAGASGDKASLEGTENRTNRTVPSAPQASQEQRLLQEHPSNSQDVAGDETSQDLKTFAAPRVMRSVSHTQSQSSTNDGSTLTSPGSEQGLPQEPWRIQGLDEVSPRSNVDPQAQRVKVTRSNTLGSFIASKARSSGKNWAKGKDLAIQEDQAAGTSTMGGLTVEVDSPSAEDEPQEGSRIFPIASAREGRRGRDGRSPMLSALAKINAAMSFQPLGGLRRKENFQSDGSKSLRPARSQGQAGRKQAESPGLHNAAESVDVHELQRTVQALQAELVFLQEAQVKEKGARVGPNENRGSLSPSPAPSPLGSSSSVHALEQFPGSFPAPAEEIAALKAELAALKSGKTSSEKRIRGLDNENAALKMQVARMEDEKAELEARVEAAEEERYVMRSSHEQEVSRLESQVDNLADQNSVLETQLASSERQLSLLDEKLQRSERERLRMEEKVNELSLLAADEANQFVEIASERKLLAKEGEELKGQLEAAKKEIGMLLDAQKGIQGDDWMRLALGKWSHGGCR